MAVQVTEQNTILSHMSEDKLRLLKSTICKGSTTDELELFLHACNRTQLDPFMRQIYFVKMGTQMTVQTGIDGYRLIAERSKKYMPGKESTFVYGKDGKLFSATSYVKKLGPDNQWHEVAATAIFSEYKGRGPLWNDKPHIMLAKCSEALALRRAFPSDLSGLYTKEEIDADQIQNLEQKPAQKIVSISSPESLVSKDEYEELENLISDESLEYRDDLLGYFTRASQSHTQMIDFSTLPKKFYSGCKNAILKRKNERMKSLEEENYSEQD